MQHHTLGRGSGAVPSGETRLSVTSSHWHNQIPPSTEHQGSWTQAQHREFPAQGTSLGIQHGFTGNTPAGRFPCSEMCRIWDVPQLLPMSSCPQPAPGWDLFVRLCQCQLSSNYSPVLSGFILQISNWCFFTQAFQLHSSN